jgi:hypothetical protein
MEKSLLFRTGAKTSQAKPSQNDNRGAEICAKRKSKFPVCLPFLRLTALLDSKKRNLDSNRGICLL